MAQLIGVAGGSGSGKTTLVEMLQHHFGADHASVLFQDAYYIDRSHEFKGDGSLNFDHPDAIDWSLLEQHLKEIRAGKTITVPTYDFVNHQRKSITELLEPKEYVIVDGILLFVHERIRNLFDIRLYVDTCESVRFQRRLERDIKERGRTPEGVRLQYNNTVRPMHDLYVEPTRVHAHQVISGETNSTITIAGLNAQLCYIPKY